MVTDQDYREKASKLKWPGLRALWKEIKARHTPDWEDGKALEYLVPRGFELEGAEVRYPYRVEFEGGTLEQIDGAVHMGSLSSIIECKDERADVTIEPIAKLRSQLARRPPGVVGQVFSTSGFTTPALELSQFLAPQIILLWFAGEVEYALQHRFFLKGLELKYRHCVETGMTDYNITVEEIT